MGDSTHRRTHRTFRRWWCYQNRSCHLHVWYFHWGFRRTTCRVHYPRPTGYLYFPVSFDSRFLLSSSIDSTVNNRAYYPHTTTVCFYGFYRSRSSFSSRHVCRLRHSSPNTILFFSSQNPYVSGKTCNPVTNSLVKTVRCDRLPSFSLTQSVVSPLRKPLKRHQFVKMLNTTE